MKHIENGTSMRTIRVKTGLRSGMGEGGESDPLDFTRRERPFRWIDTGAVYFGTLNAFPGERHLQRFIHETYGWLKSPRSRLREMVFPRQKLIRRERYWELDAIRGGSVIMMIAQHFIVAGLGLVSRALSVAVYGFWELAKTWIFLGLLSYFSGVAFTSPRAPRPSRRLSPGLGKFLVMGIEFAVLVALVSWLVTSGSGAAGFMLVMGMSMSISYARAMKNQPEKAFFPKAIKRSTMLFLGAGLLSVLSFLIRPDATVSFGILHLFGASSLAALPFLSLPAAISLLGGIAAIVLGMSVKTSNPALSWLVQNPAGYRTLDYFPLFPWFGAILIGLALGKILYPNGERAIPIADLSEKKPVEFLTWVGEHALAIFMLQEPLYFLGKARVLA